MATCRRRTDCSRDLLARRPCRCRCCTKKVQSRAWHGREVEECQYVVPVVEQKEIKVTQSRLQFTVKLAYRIKGSFLLELLRVQKSAFDRDKLKVDLMRW
jgi:hypothetical protein